MDHSAKKTHTQNLPISSHGWTRRRALVLAAVAILSVLYISGRLDYTLYPLGLNLHACARNGLGATFCGDDLTAYQQRFRGIQQQLRQSQQSITQAECQADPALSFCSP